MDRSRRLRKRIDDSLQPSRAHLFGGFLGASVCVAAFVGASWTVLIATALCTLLLLWAFCTTE